MSALCQKQTFVSAAQIPFGCYDSFVTAIIDADFFARVLGSDYVGRKRKRPSAVGTPKNDARRSKPLECNAANTTQTVVRLRALHTTNLSRAAW